MKVPVKRCITCQARIIWAVSQHGNPMPLDAKPRSHGYLRLQKQTPDKGDRTILVAIPDTGDQNSLWGENQPRYTSHHATCKDAAYWRQQRKEQSK